MQRQVRAQALYERAGFAVEGDEFVLADIGPHFVMVLPITESQH